jgi:hypothetical protein
MAKEIEIPIPAGYEIDKEKTNDKKIVFKQKEGLIIDLNGFKKIFDCDVFLNGDDYLGIGLNGLKKLPKLYELYDEYKAEKTGYSAGVDELCDRIQDFNDLINDDEGEYTPEVKEILRGWYKDLLDLITRGLQESGLSEDEKRCLEGWKKELKDPDKYLK